MSRVSSGAATHPRPVGASPKSRLGRRLVWIWVALLFLLHHDFWWWDDGALVFGFLPLGLAYHCAYSLVAGITWWLATRFAWPEEIEEWASSGDATGAPGRSE